MLTVKINVDKETNPGALAKIVDLLKEYDLESVIWENSSTTPGGSREIQAVRQAQQRDV